MEVFSQEAILSAQRVWAAAQQALKAIFKSSSYDIWFTPLQPKGLVDETLYLETDNEFSEIWIRQNYLDYIKEAIYSTSGLTLNIKLLVAPKKEQSPPATPPPDQSEFVFNNASDDSEKSHQLLNPRYTFDNFIVGENNNFAHAAAIAVAKNLGKTHNPLFIYGGVGLGKTHLLHAIGHYSLENRKNIKIACVSTERFTNEFIEALQNNKLSKFRKKYRQTDLLLIDDIHFLEGKERIQEEFFFTFNALHEVRRQIVMTSDRPVGQIQNLEQRLVSRFEWGLIAELGKPGFETRVAILRKKEKQLGVNLSDEIINFIAQNIRSNIRRLEGALTRVAYYSTLTKKELTIEAVSNLLKDILREENNKEITIDVIKKTVAERFDLRLADLMSRRRPENIAFPRQIAMYLSRKLTNQTLNSIGEAFGGRDHGTVLHACKLVEDRMEVDSNVRDLVQHLINKLTG